MINLNEDQDEACPLISVVMPVYNGEKYLVEAVDSILNQTFTDFELIMIDDGSTDGSLSILQQYGQLDLRVRIISRENKGLPTTLNELVDIARGKWIARMDQDDICMPNRLVSQIEFMHLNPTTAVLGSSANFMEKDGGVICTYVVPTNDAELRIVFPESPFIHPSIMFSKEIFYKAGKYNEKMKWGGEDVTFFKRMSRLGKLQNLSEPLINYRLVPGSMSRKPSAFRNILTRIIEDDMAGNTVSDERFEALQQEAKKSDKSKALFDYHFEVAKLYAWSGGSRARARVHLNKCFESHYLLLRVALMNALLFLPKSWVKLAYFKMKKRRFVASENFH